MYMVFELNGLQYDGMLGDHIEVDLLDNPGKDLKIDKVMYLSNKEKGTHVGQPYLEGAEITALYEKDVKADKILVFRYKPKKKFRKRKGHRQGYSQIHLTAVKFGDISLTKKDEAPAQACSRDPRGRADQDRASRRHDWRGPDCGISDRN